MNNTSKLLIFFFCLFVYPKSQEIVHFNKYQTLIKVHWFDTLFCIQKMSHLMSNWLSVFTNENDTTTVDICVILWLYKTEKKNLKEVITDLIKHSDNIEISLSFTKHERFIWTCPTPLIICRSFVLYIVWYPYTRWWRYIYSGADHHSVVIICFWKSNGFLGYLKALNRCSTGLWAVQYIHTNFFPWCVHFVYLLFVNKIWIFLWCILYMICGSDYGHVKFSHTIRASH